MVEPHFYGALFENWESEFLQMGMFVVLSVMFQQKGSSESKDLDEHEDVDDEPARTDKRLPEFARARGFTYALYKNSLSIALFGLFAISFVLHAYAGAKAFNVDQSLHGEAAIGMFAFMGKPEFWFQSFQNWQSEFLAVAVLGILSIFLRQKGSPQSKPLAAANSDTGA